MAMQHSPLYQAHLGESTHLEIGVGTGCYPAASVSSLAKTKRITLLDLSPDTLAYAKQHVARAGYNGELDLLEHDVFEPLPTAMHGTCDSVTPFYVFHCLHGTFPDKAERVFANVAPLLAPHGVVYGSTILGQGLSHNWLGTRPMIVYNKKGIFGNVGDTRDGLQTALERYFEDYDIRIVVVVALFSARRPRSQTLN